MEAIWRVPASIMVFPVVIGIARLLPTLVKRPAVTYVFLRAFQQIAEVDLPSWAVLLLCMLSIPAGFYANSFLKRRKDERNAAANAAVLPNKVEGSSLQNLRAIMAMNTTGYLGDKLVEWAKTYGNAFRFDLIGEERFFTTEPEHIKAILATQFKSFEKGPVQFDQFHTLLGAGVFNSDGDMWKFHRSMTRPFFSKDRISEFDNFEVHADDVISRIKARLAEGYPVEFQDAVGRFTLDSATTFLFGNDVCSLSAGLPYPPNSGVPNPTSFTLHSSNSFVHAFAEAQELNFVRQRMGPYWRFFEPKQDVVQPLRDTINKYVDVILEDALREQREKGDTVVEGKGEVEEGESFLQHLLKHTQDKKIIQDELVNILVAGRDTTASLLTFCVYMMAEHPDVTKRLRQEILEKVGSSRRPSYEDLRDMKYLRAFVNETLRLYPAVPFNARSTTEPVLLTTGKPGETPIYLPKGTRSLYSVFLTHRRKDLWGPTAHEFDPNRFIDDRLTKYLTPNPYIFVPFNAGPRICLGQQFAYNEASFFLVRLLQNFEAFQLCEETTSKVPREWALAEGTQATERIRMKSSLTMYAKDGLWVTMTEAKEENI